MITDSLGNAGRMEHGEKKSQLISNRDLNLKKGNIKIVHKMAS
jgi:hypothetical protein